MLMHITLMRMPYLAATPVPTITAVGVARPSAHGHAMTKTVAPKSRAKRPALLPSGIHCAGTAPERAARQLDSIYKKVCILQSIEARQSTSIVSDMRPIGQHAKLACCPCAPSAEICKMSVTVLQAAVSNRCVSQVVLAKMIHALLG